MTEFAVDDLSPQPALASLTALLRRRRLALLLFATGVALLVGGFQYLRPLTYTSRTEFIPQARRQGSLAAGFAAQLGVSLPGTDPAQSPVFYADLAKSPDILARVVQAGVRDRGGRPLSYSTYYKVTERDTAVAREMFVDHLAADIVAAVAPKTGVVSLSMQATDPAAAAGTLANVLAALEVYNSISRRSQASAERRFAERRQGEVRAELATAEDVLMRFLQSNRDFKNSPTLTFQQDRMAREVTQKQQVYASLSQAVEQARLDEVRDTPVLSVVEPPRVAARADRRRLLMKVVVSFTLAIGGAVVLCAMLLLAEDLFAVRILPRIDEAGRSTTQVMVE